MNPFPGINPYLETPQFWRAVHNSLIHDIYLYLNRVLPEGFAAMYEERVILLPMKQNLVPHAAVTQTILSMLATQPVGSTALLDDPAVHGRVAIEWEEETDSYVEIVTTDRAAKVITIIEILSPSNKTPGEDHEKYKQKQAAILASETNLLEIDLLRKGKYTVAIPETVLHPFGTWHGIASLHQAVRRREYEYWLCRMSEPLPPVTIPLMPDLPEISCDLNEIYQRIYDEGRFAQRIDYSVPPPILMTEDEQQWIDALLREKGLRP